MIVKKVLKLSYKFNFMKINKAVLNLPQLSFRQFLKPTTCLFCRSICLIYQYFLYMKNIEILHYDCFPFFEKALQIVFRILNIQARHPV